MAEATGDSAPWLRRVVHVHGMVARARAAGTSDVRYSPSTVQYWKTPASDLCAIIRCWCLQPARSASPPHLHRGAYYASSDIKSDYRACDRQCFEAGYDGRHPKQCHSRSCECFRIKQQRPQYNTVTHQPRPSSQTSPHFRLGDVFGNRCAVLIRYFEVVQSRDTGRLCCQEQVRMWETARHTV